MIIFGAQILALTEDGSRMFAWNTTTGGTLMSFYVFHLTSRPNEYRFRFVYRVRPWFYRSSYPSPSNLRQQGSCLEQPRKSTIMEYSVAVSTRKDR